MQYVIIGGSAAGISAVEAIRSRDKNGRISLFSDEKTALFSRVLLPYYLAEEIEKPGLNFRSTDFFEENRIQAHLGARIATVNTSTKSVTCEDGRSFPYDRLLIATGGRAIVPNLPGVDQDNISPFKTMADAEKIRSMPCQKAVVIGAGAIGVEACISLRRKGAQVTLLEQMDQVLPMVFDAEAASILQEVIKGHGIKVCTGERAKAFLGTGRVQRVVTSRREIPCDTVVLAAGIRPDVELAHSAGMEIGSLGGIKTDALMQTSVRDVFAAGDVCETYDMARGGPFINALWPLAMEQGRIAGLNMAGEKARYPGSLRMNSIGSFLGFPAMSLGITSPDECSYLDEDCYFQVLRRRTRNTFTKFILKSGVIVGAILVGRIQKTGVISLLMRKQIDVSDYLDLLMGRNLNFMDLLPILRRNALDFPESEFREIMATGL